MSTPSTSLPQGRHTELKQGSDEWLAVRKGVVTGSRVAGILGHNPYSSYEKVMDEMLRQHHGLEPRFKGNTATEWGNAHEADARISFEAQYGTVVNETGFHFHPDYDYIGASPDGLIFGDGLEAVTEFKCPYSGKIPEHPPLHYVDQCQMVMWVMDVTVCSLYYWTEDESKSFTIYVDTDWQDATLPVINDFIDDFNKRKQEEYVDFIEVTDTEAITEANILADLRANIRELQDQEKELSAKLKEYADEKHDTIIGCMKVTHVTRKGNINAKRILKDTGIDIELYRNKPITVTMIKEMKYMNLFAFTGNLGADAEVKYTPSGVAICEMRVAVRAGYGERQKTLWVRASLWGKRAEGGIVPYLVKGQTVAINGELSTSEWENKDGVKQTTLEVKVNEVDLIGKRDDSVQEAKPKQEPEKKPDFDDDVPW